MILIDAGNFAEMFADIRNFQALKMTMLEEVGLGVEEE